MNLPDPASLLTRWFGALPAPGRSAVERLRAAAGETPLYAAGGSVRDVILGRPFADVDLAYDGDAPALARAAFPDARITTHARFGTASLSIAGARIDIAMTRAETYARPGALPAVAPARIKDDLRRRDFTVNALALALTGPPALFDPTGGLADIEARLIRALHDRSFEDDPTRIFRAFRYAARLDFEVEPHTRSLITAALPHIAGVSGDRLRRELELLFVENDVHFAVSELDLAGALAAVHPVLAYWPSDRELFSEFSPPARCALGFALLASSASAEEVEAIITRLRLKRSQATAVRDLAALRSHAATLARPDAKPSGVALLLDRYSEPAITAFAATTDSAVAATLARDYLREWRSVRPMLTGDDLRAIGVPAGPQVQRALQLIRAARLDGWASTRDDERALAARFAKSIRDSGAMNATIELHTNGN